MAPSGFRICSRSDVVFHVALHRTAWSARSRELAGASGTWPYEDLADASGEVAGGIGRRQPVRDPVGLEQRISDRDQLGVRVIAADEAAHLVRRRRRMGI